MANGVVSPGAGSEHHPVPIVPNGVGSPGAGSGGHNHKTGKETSYESSDDSSVGGGVGNPVMIGYEIEYFSFLIIAVLFSAGNAKKNVFTVFIDPIVTIGGFPYVSIRAPGSWNSHWIRIFLAA